MPTAAEHLYYHKTSESERGRGIRDASSKALLVVSVVSLRLELLCKQSPKSNKTDCDLIQYIGLPCTHFSEQMVKGSVHFNNK